MSDNYWLQTFSGRKFYPFDPKPEDVHIEDIAHALALTCRWGGQCREFWSVAQHSVLVSRHCDQPDALWGLLHDAAEAYLVDLPRPLKRKLRDDGNHVFDLCEGGIMRAVCRRFGLPEAAPASVKKADDLLLYTEARDLMADTAQVWSVEAKDVGHDALPDRLRAQPWEVAEARFLARFTSLTNGRAT